MNHYESLDTLRTIDQRTTDQKVRGSNPCGRTTGTFFK
jgi:hypothetical protein